MEDLARYAIRASFSQERMSYVEEDRIVLSTTGQRTARSRRSLTPWNGWSRLCRDGLTSPTRESRWSAAMATTYKQQCFPRQLEQAEPRRPHTVIIIYSAKHKKVFVIDLQTGRVFVAADPRRDGTVIYVKGGWHWPPKHKW